MARTQFPGLCLCLCRLLCLFTWLGGVVVPVGSVAQGAQAAPLALPPSGVLDDGRVFSEAQRAEMETYIRTVTNGSPVGLVALTYTILSGTTAEDRARQLADQWYPNAPALIMLYTRAGSQPALVATGGLWDRYPADDVVALLLKMRQSLADGKRPPEETFLAAAQHAAEVLPRLETQRQARLRLFRPYDFYLAAGLGIALIVFGSGAAWMAQRMALRREQDQETLWFPEVEVGMRLNAPFGGGVTAETGPGQIASQSPRTSGPVG